MKCKNYGKGLLAATLLLGSSNLLAYNFYLITKNADNTGYCNIYFNVTDYNKLTCEVTYKDENYNSYSGDIIIPESVRYNGCTYTVTGIGHHAFCDCYNLTSINLSNTITTIGTCSFESCYELTSVELPQTVTTISSYAFHYCHAIASINIPDGVTEIDEGAFDQCSSLTSISFSENVISIPRGVCTGCESLTELVIGKSVTKIDEYAFNYCDKLKSITSLNPEPPEFESDNAFVASVKASCTLYVPNGSKDAYSVADVWKDFLDIEEIGTMGIEDVLSDGQAEEVARYTIDGRQINAPQKGVNIIRYSDGTTKKVMVE